MLEVAETVTAAGNAPLDCENSQIAKNRYKNMRLKHSQGQAVVQELHKQDLRGNYHKNQKTDHE